jgi:hypothetical protein
MVSGILVDARAFEGRRPEFVHHERVGAVSR